MQRPELGDWRLRRAGSWFGGLLLVAWTIAWVCGGSACRSTETPEETPRDSSGDAISVEAEAPGDAAAPAPSSGAVSEASVAPSTVAPSTVGGGTTPGARPILPSTRRTSEGLPDTLSGYQTWYRLDPATSAEGRGPHLKLSRTYVLLPEIHTVGVGDRLTPPFADETVLVLESKGAESDFIEAISMMKRTAGTWEYKQFVRPDSESAFRAAAGQADACAGCHSRAPTDSVFAQLELR